MARGREEEHGEKLGTGQCAVCGRSCSSLDHRCRSEGTWGGQLVWDEQAEPAKRCWRERLVSENIEEMLSLITA